jgi:glucokinase
MEIVDSLVEEGLIREGGTGVSTGGRRPVLLEMVQHAHRAVGLEVGAKTLTAVVVDLAAQIKLRLQAPSRMSEGPEAVEEEVRNILRRVLEEISKEAEATADVLGIGLALPGPLLASDEKAVFSPPSYPGWGEIALGEFVFEEFGLPVLVDNDGNAAALGEHLFGAGRGVDDMVHVVVHRGVGGALIMGGELYRGSNGVAGEIGHSIVDADGPRCGCGRHGCLEAFVGRTAITRRARNALKLAGVGGINDKSAEEIRAQDVIEAGLAGDELAISVLAETGQYLGLGISTAVNMCDPELVVVGGSTMRAGDLVLGPAIEVVRKRALPGIAEKVEVVAGQLGDDAGAIGAASLVLRELFAQGSQPMSG